jgi:hypothetical protein
LHHQYMQAVFHDAPPGVTMRLTAELALAARRELGHPDTSLDAVDIMGVRITDIYDEDGVPMAWAALPLEVVYASEEWTSPWGDRYDET